MSAIDGDGLKVSEFTTIGTKGDQIFAFAHPRFQAFLDLQELPLRWCLNGKKKHLCCAVARDSR